MVWKIGSNFCNFLPAKLRFVNIPWKVDKIFPWFWQWKIIIIHAIHDKINILACQWLQRINHSYNIYENQRFKYTLAINDWAFVIFFTNFPGLSKFRYVKSPSLSYNLQVYHLGNDFHDYESSVPVNGPATDEKSFAVNHTNNTLELFINPALLLKKIEKPTPSCFIPFTFDSPWIFISSIFHRNRVFHPIDNRTDVLSIHFIISNCKISRFKIFEFLISISEENIEFVRI